jgi:branched-chain amino acid transport system substrate-binding protein
MLLGRVRSPAEMEGQHEWDIYNILTTIPAEDAARPLPVGECYLVK